MKLKCVAILGTLFLRTHEVSLQIDGCLYHSQTQLANGEVSQENVSRIASLNSEHRIKRIPFDFVKSSTKVFLSNFFLTIFLSSLNFLI